MSKKTHIILVLVLIFLLQAVLLIAGSVTDQVGRTLVVPENPTRVIALAPSITEIIYDLGQEKRLVGVTQYSTYPSEAELLPRVGSYVRLDIEKIVALKPDLCLATKDGNPKHIVDKIVSLGIPVYVINPQNLQQIMDTITRLGSLLHAEQTAAALVSDMEKRIGQVQARVKNMPDRPRVFFQIDAEPLFSAGTDTFIHELIELAGGINTTAGEVSYPRYSWEDIIVLQPEIVLISSMAGGLAPEYLLNSWKKWNLLSAVKNDQIFVVDAELFDRPTPRLVNGLEVIAAIIHPELFIKSDQKLEE
ncbi:MAG: cobalamin-binding protein [Desulfobulbaceae bacterium]|jgi:iron complex transport system substrate-binding protein|nr:cobalamin-binding protein [Desulfobulbaceae bacterium]MDH3782267.1 cobalamin-binding protein [Desulfobulbaceae bacterium]MDH3866563.1 cobalamin-binding protein [Desulfobulbaceae bacterium]MDH3921968.1 cobalamin-binding protein [Desulfobulbaceae bacterium]HKJ13645.1 cobalamin-binding protein [Desulfobulbales bacterium]